MKPLLLAALVKLKELAPLKFNRMDYLNVTITSRAPENTALSNAVWTNARANNLNGYISDVASQASVTTLQTSLNATNSNVDVPFSSMLSTVFGSRKVQRGTVTAFSGRMTEVADPASGGRIFYIDVVISPVSNIANCLVIIEGIARLGGSTSLTNLYQFSKPWGELINTSTLRVSCIAPSFANPALIVTWQVAEFT